MEHRDFQRRLKEILVAPRGPGECERCRRLVCDIGFHDYWPIYRLCRRCVGQLLEMQWRPFIPLPDGRFYVCEDEAEWHRIKLSEQLPAETPKNQVQFVTRS